MKKMKKIIAVLTAAVISVTALVTTAFTASAKGVFDNAVTMKAMTYYSLNNLDRGDYEFFKITLKSSGDLTLRWSYGGGVHAELYDSSANIVQEDFFIGYSRADERTIKELKKGTYYLKIFGNEGYTASVDDLYYVFNSDGKSTVSYEEPTATIALKLEKGDSFRVSVVTTDYDGKIKWTTTKKSVATISKGKVVAKGTGKARIRAYLDDGSYTEIMVIVE